ncbi:PTS fructose transporter subunit IIABC [Devriesea agamarum]|uniref:PTS fructose transporter subunit IIABC n=1 Tax=Devriesea agamarum TaxID=472569 RepID=UPI00071CC0DD|nr:fructose-specific PTS transporter subunit EIIC [Devriesea agamarum]
MTDLITADLVSLDADSGDGSDRFRVIRAMAARIAAKGRASDAEQLFADAKAREAQTDTGIPGGIAIPHCRSSAVSEPTIAMSRLNPPVAWGADDGPADLAFFIAVPDGADQQHLVLLSSLARALVRPEFTASLRDASSANEIVQLVNQAIHPEPASQTPPTSTNRDTAATSDHERDTSAPANADTSGGQTGSAQTVRLVAVTACPTGIAHTYMAADSLAATAQSMGIDLQVETQGSAGSKPLPQSVIDAADAVIFAVEVDVRDKHRFAGKPVVNASVKRGIDEPKVLIEQAVQAAADPSATRVLATTSERTDGASESSASSESFGRRLKKALLTGVSYMIPFVAGGGLLIALGFLLLGPHGTIEMDPDTVLKNASLFNLGDVSLNIYLGNAMVKIGQLSMGFLVPALAGYIAYGLADRPGIAPGFVAGSVASFMGAGFLGGILGGILAGILAYYLAQMKVHRYLRGLMPVVIIPLLTSLVVSGVLLLFLGHPIAFVMNAMTDGLNSMTGAQAILLGILLGVMMGSDLGGPINKVAYSFAVAGLGTATAADPGAWRIMAAVMGAGMVPPLGMALATVIRRRWFTVAERENGTAAFFLGSFFITEGAIPFAAADPFRVIPASIVGSGVTGALVMAFDVTLTAPHGGFVVGFAIGHFGWFIASVAIGAIVTAAVVIALKRIGRRPAAAAA